MTTLSLYPTHTIICKVPQSSSVSQPQRPVRFSNASQRREFIDRWTKNVHGEVITYTLDGVSIHPVTTKIQASFLPQLPENKETTQGFHHEAIGALLVQINIKSRHWMFLLSMVSINYFLSINYTLDGVLIHPVTTKIQVSFLTQLMERNETSPWGQWGL